MAKTKGPRFPELVLWVAYDEPEPGSDYMFIRGGVCTTNPNVYLSTYEVERGGKFAHVSFKAQTDKRRLGQETREYGWEPMYGHKPEWFTTHSDLASLKEGVAALTEVVRRMEAIEDKFGRHASFGTWVQRLAVAIGCDKIRFSNEREPRPCGLTWWELDSAARKIDGKILEWSDRFRRVPATA